MAQKQPRPADLRALSAADLIAQREKLRQELWQHRMKLKEGAAQQTHLSRVMRRQIARVETMLKAQPQAQGSAHASS